MSFARRCFSNSSLTAVALAATFGAAAHGQVTWHVDAAAPDCLGTGGPADPFCSVQTAIDAALDGDTVVVAPGTYAEALDFGGRAIVVRSSGGPMTTVIDATGLDAPVASFRSGEGAASVLQGFALTGGVGAPDPVFGFFRFGGGVYCDMSGPTLSHCVISNNGADFGAGMCVINGGDPTLVNCQVTDNVGQLGGGVYNDLGGVLEMVGCTVAGNVAGFGGGVYDLETATIRNSILWGNTPDNLISTPATVAVFTNVQGGFVGTGNMDADPLFVSPGGGDFRLAPGSPCLDAGHNWILPRDDRDLDGDGDLLEQTPFDLDWAARFAVGSASAATGCGNGAVVDMGAYELNVAGAAYVRLGDLDGDGFVGDPDLALLEADWGPCADTCCLSDLDRDGDVGMPDMLLLLAQWGGPPAGNGDDGGDDDGDVGDGGGDDGDDAPWTRGRKVGHSKMKPKRHPGRGHARGHEKHGFSTR